MTVLHAGGKFNHSNYKVSGGLHGVGVSVVNALSEWLKLEIKRDGKTYYQEYRRGDPGDAAVGDRRLREERHQGHVQARSRDLQGDRVQLRDPDPAAARAFVPEPRACDHDPRRAHGQVARVQVRGRHRAVRRRSERVEDARARQADRAWRAKSTAPQVDIALQWNDSYQEAIYCFTNNIKNKDGGTHLTGFRAALTRTVNAYAQSAGLLKDLKAGLGGDDISEGLTAIVSIKHPDPKFSNQPKDKLVSSEVKGIVERIVNEKLGRFLEEHPRESQADHREGRARRARPRRRPQGARDGAAQGRARFVVAARQAGRLPGARSGAGRAVHRRGRQRRRLRQAGAQPQGPGDPAAARQDPERREGAAREDAVVAGDRHADHRARLRRRAGEGHRRRSATTGSSS